MLLALSIQAFTSCFQPGICLNNSQLNQYCTFFLWLWRSGHYGYNIFSWQTPASGYWLDDLGKLTDCQQLWFIAFSFHAWLWHDQLNMTWGWVIIQIATIWHLVLVSFIWSKCPPLMPYRRWNLQRNKFCPLMHLWIWVRDIGRAVTNQKFTPLK